MQAYNTFLEEQLLLEHSKTQAQKLCEWIGTDTERMTAFMHIFLGENYRMTQRGAWVIGHISKERPEVLRPWLAKMVAALRSPNHHVSIRRNVVRHFDIYGFPDELMDDLADLCFGYLADPNEAVAVRAFSMGVLEEVCKRVPELKSELRLLLEEHIPHGTSGFKSRGKKILAKL